MNTTFWSLPTGLLMHAGLNPHFIATFCLFLAIMLLWTCLCGIILEKVVRLPLVAGYIVAGIVLGPSILNIAQWPIFAHPVILHDMIAHQQYAIAGSDLSIFFVLLISGSITVAYLLWLAGYETQLEEIAQVGTAAVTAGVLGAVLPIIVIGAALYYVGGSWTLPQAIGMGVIFSATSVSIPVAMLFATNRMHLRSSKATLGAAIIDDVLAVVLLSIFFIVLETGVFGSAGTMIKQAHSTSLGAALGYMVATGLCLTALGYYAFPIIMRLFTKWGYGQVISLFAVIFMLFYFAGAELLGGFAGITGAYLAGFLFRRADTRHYAHKILTPFVQSVLLPLFLGSIGLQINVGLLHLSDWLVVGWLLVLAIIAKLVGCWIATSLSNVLGRTPTPWSLLESYLFGSSMVARGEVGLVVATVLYGLQLLTSVQYIIGIVVIVLTTIASPIMLAIGFAQEKTEGTGGPVMLGRFELFGSLAMFNAMVHCLEQNGYVVNRVQMADGGQAALVDGQNIKLLLSPTQGVSIEGNNAKVREILTLIATSLSEEIQGLER